MTYTEEATLFDCAGDTLLGILARPAAPADTAVVVGGPQYRAGSRRQFVLMPRALAAAIDALQQPLPCIKQVVLWGAARLL
jgi:hypothetical protein